MGLPLAMVPVGVPVGKVFGGVGFGDGDDEPIYGSNAVVEGSEAGAVVGDPPGLPEVRGTPQGLTRWGSVTGATPEVLATRLTWV